MESICENGEMEADWKVVNLELGELLGHVLTVQMRGHRIGSFAVSDLAAFTCVYPLLHCYIPLVRDLGIVAP